MFTLYVYFDLNSWKFNFSEQKIIEKKGLFSIKETDDGILLEKFSTVDINLSELERELLEFLIQESCDKDVSINEVISDLLEKGLELYK